MKNCLTVSAGCILFHMIAPMVAAEDLPPILDPKGYRQTLPGMLPPAQTPAVGTLKGIMRTTDGLPLSGGKVFFFNGTKGPPPATEKYWRVPDETASIDDNGGFTVELPPGRYYLGAIQRKQNNLMVGLPAEGDIYYDGKILYEVLAGAINNIDVIRGGKQFLLDLRSHGESVTAIEGSVLDLSGKPVENALVFAYIKAEMNDRPLFVSVRTDKSGAYQLKVAGEGTFFLRADVYGGSFSGTGTAMGVGRGRYPKAVKVKKGEVIKGIDISGVEFGISR